MNPYFNKEESGSCMVVDMWGPFRGKYPDPTPEEFDLIVRYLRKFEFEDVDFVERKAFKSLKNRLQCPNLRDLLIKFLRQVRGSKGYDVDLYFDFIVQPYTKFLPRSLDDKKFYDEAMAATMFAIREINTRMVSSGKTYELVSVNKSVSATRKTWAPPKEVVDRKRISITTNTLLLTFTANEITVAPDASVVVLLQAMVIECDGPSSTFQLKEWKYKPFLIASSYY